MGKVQGRLTYISLNGVELSAHTNASAFNRGADIEDVTTYGATDHEFAGTLGNNAPFAISGFYDDSVTGPRDTIEPLIGTTVPYVRRVEGTGSGKPQDSVSVVVGEYVETSPVAGHVTWACTLTPSGAVTSTNQA